MKLTNDEIEYIVSLNYNIYTDSFGHLYNLINGNRYIWPIMFNSRDLNIGLQTADIINNKFTNHKKFKSLKEALDRPL